MSRTDVLLAALLAEIEARRARFDADGAQGSVKLVVKFRCPGAPAGALTFRFAFGADPA